MSPRVPALCSTRYSPFCVNSPAIAASPLTPRRAQEIFGALWRTSGLPGDSSATDRKSTSAKGFAAPSSGTQKRRAGLNNGDRTCLSPLARHGKSAAARAGSSPPCRCSLAPGWPLPQRASSGSQADRFGLVFHIQNAETPHARGSQPLHGGADAQSKQGCPHGSENRDSVLSHVCFAREDDPVSAFAATLQVLDPHPRMHGDHVGRYLIGLHDDGSLQFLFQSVEAVGISWIYASCRRNQPFQAPIVILGDHDIFKFHDGSLLCFSGPGSAIAFSPMMPQPTEPDGLHAPRSPASSLALFGRDPAEAFPRSCPCRFLKAVPQCPYLGVNQKRLLTALRFARYRQTNAKPLSQAAIPIAADDLRSRTSSTCTLFATGSRTTNTGH